MITPSHSKYVTSGWSRVTSDQHGKVDPILDYDWSFRQKSNFRRIKKKPLPDPKESRLRLQAAMIAADQARKGHLIEQYQRLRVVNPPTHSVR